MPQTEVPDEFAWMSAGRPRPDTHPYPHWADADTLTDMHAINDDGPFGGIKVLQEISELQCDINPEPRVKSWPLTLAHRTYVIVLVSITVTALYAIQQYFWPGAIQPHDEAQRIWSWLGVLWCIASVPQFFELAGLLSWRAPHAPLTRINNLVCWRIVSRGINKDALCDTIQSCRDEMAKTPLFPWTIEVLVDTDTTGGGLPPEAHDLHYIRVPADYETPGGTRNKARALNYALETSPLPNNAWLLHLDEESHPTESGIKGIAAAIAEEEESGQLRIGQGTITYHRDWAEHPFFTLSDCVRTGSDLGRLYLSMKMGVPIFGLHGSFILVRNDVEKWLGFDVGPIGSLTEDAWWGTIAMEEGYRCRWVEGHIEEQCTQRMSDFLKQRGRWFNGLGRTALKAPASLRWRIGILISLICWASAPLSWAYTIGHLILGGYISPEIKAIANLSLAIYIATTLIGLRVNMRDHGIHGTFAKVRWALSWLVCLPVFNLMESLAITRAIIKPTKQFHVVKK